LEAGFSALTPDEQLLVVLWGLEADVNNGGFHQYYFNSYGNFAQLASRMLRQKALESMEADSWDLLDTRFWAYPDHVSALLRKHLGL
jgi:hypothetical protein